MIISNGLGQTQSETTTTQNNGGFEFFSLNTFSDSVTQGIGFAVGGAIAVLLFAALPGKWRRRLTGK